MTIMLMLTIMFLVIYISFKDKILYNNLIVRQIKVIIYNHVPKATGDLYTCTDKTTGEKVHIPLKDRFLHCLILGPTGSGKSSLLLMPMLKQDIENYDVGVLLIEPKGDLAEKVYALAQLNNRNAIYFNPMYKNCPKFNPLQGDETVVIENMVLVFRMLLEESPDYYKDLSEKLLRMSIKVIKRTLTNPTFLDLERFLSNSGGFRENQLMTFREKSNTCHNIESPYENNQIIQFLANEYFDIKGSVYQRTSGLRAQLARINDNKYLRNVLNPHNGVSDFNFEDALEYGQIITMTTSQGVLNQTLSTLLGRLLIINFQSAVVRRPGNESTRKAFFLYLDEFQEYANPNFNILLTQGRSYRVSSTLATQNRQLIAGNGSAEGQIFLESVSANCRNVFLLPDLPYTDALYYSETFGTKESKRISLGKSKNHKDFSYTGFSKTSTIEDVPILTPTDIMNQPFGNVSYKIIRNNSVTDASIGRTKFIDSETNHQINLMASVNHKLLSNGYSAHYISTDIKITGEVDKVIDTLKGEYENDKT